MFRKTQEKQQRFLLFNSINQLPYLVVALQDGSLLVYPINPAEGGECQLIKQHK